MLESIGASDSWHDSELKTAFWVVKRIIKSILKSAILSFSKLLIGLSICLILKITQFNTKNDGRFPIKYRVETDVGSAITFCSDV